MAFAALGHRRQQRHDQAHGAEVVQLHRPFEVMEAVEAFHHRTTDRATGVVDQDVDMAEVAQHLGGHVVDRLHVDQIAGVDVTFAARLGDDVLRLDQRRFGTRHQDHPGAGDGEILGGGETDAAGRTGDQDHLAGHLGDQLRAWLVVDVEELLPVAPDRLHVVAELGALDTGALERGAGVLVIEHRTIGDVAEHRDRRPDRLGNLVLDRVRQRAAHLAAELADGTRHRRQLVLLREARPVRGLEDRLDQVADAGGIRLHQMEGLAVQAVLVGNRIDRIGHVIDRRDRHLAAFDAEQRQPLRNAVAQLLDGLEEVVRAVDLVHLAGLGMTDDGARTVDPERQLRFLANDLFALELGAEIRVLDRLAFVEHVLGEAAVEIAASDRDARHVMQHHVSAKAVGESHGVARAFVVDPVTLLVAHVHVVHGGEMEDVRNTSLELLQVRRRHQARRGDVAGHHVQAVGIVTVALLQCRELVLRCRPNQHVDGGIGARQQALDQMLADEAGRAGDEVIHLCSSAPMGPFAGLGRPIMVG